VSADIEHAYAATPGRRGRRVIARRRRRRGRHQPRGLRPGAADLEPLSLQVDKIAPREVGTDGQPLRIVTPGPTGCLRRRQAASSSAIDGRPATAGRQ